MSMLALLRFLQSPEVQRALCILAIPLGRWLALRWEERRYMTYDDGHPPHPHVQAWFDWPSFLIGIRWSSFPAFYVHRGPLTIGLCGRRNEARRSVYRPAVSAEEEG